MPILPTNPSESVKREILERADDGQTCTSRRLIRATAASAIRPLRSAPCYPFLPPNAAVAHLASNLKPTMPPSPPHTLLSHVCPHTSYPP